MSTALDELKRRVNELDERDDKVLDLVQGLKTEVADLRTALETAGYLDGEIQALADKLGETVGKMDTALAGCCGDEPPVNEQSA